jgi:hypothetical protein
MLAGALPCCETLLCRARKHAVRVCNPALTHPHPHPHSHMSASSSLRRPPRRAPWRVRTCAVCARGDTSDRGCVFAGVDGKPGCICTRTRAHICAHAHTHTYTRTYVHTHTHTCTLVCTRTYAHAHTHNTEPVSTPGPRARFLDGVGSLVFGGAAVGARDLRERAVPGADFGPAEEDAAGV